MQAKQPANADAPGERVVPMNAAARELAEPLAELRRLQTHLAQSRGDLQVAAARLEEVVKRSENDRALRENLERDLAEALRDRPELERAAQIGREHARNAKWLAQQRITLLSRVADLEKQAEELSARTAENAELERAAQLGREHAKNAAWLAEQRTHLLDRIAELENQAAQSQGLRAQVDATSRELEEALRYVAELERAAQAGAQHGTNAARLAEQRARLLARIAELEQHAQTLSARFETATDALNGSQSELLQVRAEAEGLRRDRNAADARIEELERHARDLNAGLETATAALAQAEVALRTSEEENAQLRVRLNESTELKERLAKNATSFSGQRAALLARVEELEEEARDLNARIESVTGENAQSSEQRTALLGRVEELEAQAHGLDERLEIVTAELTRAQSAARAVEDENAQLRARLEEALDAKGRHAKNAAWLSEQRVMLLARVGDLEKQAQSLQSEIASLGVVRTATYRLGRRVAFLTDAVAAQQEAAQEQARRYDALVSELQQQSGRAARYERESERARALADSFKFAAAKAEDDLLQARGEYEKLYERATQLAKALAQTSHQLSAERRSVELRTSELEVERTLHAQTRAEAEEWVEECERLMAVLQERNSTLQMLRQEAVADDAARKELQSQSQSLARDLNAAAQGLAWERQRAAQEKAEYERRLNDLTERFRQFAEVQLTRTHADIAALSSAIDRVQGGRIWGLKAFLRSLPSRLGMRGE